MLPVRGWLDQFIYQWNRNQTRPIKELIWNNCARFAKNFALDIRMINL